MAIYFIYIYIGVYNISHAFANRTLLLVVGDKWWLNLAIKRDRTSQIEYLRIEVAWKIDGRGGEKGHPTNWWKMEEEKNLFPWPSIFAILFWVLGNRLPAFPGRQSEWYLILSPSPHPKQPDYCSPTCYTVSKCIFYFTSSLSNCIISAFVFHN